MTKSPKRTSGTRAEKNSPIGVLFLASADADNTNAQSLNAREIALRLDPRRFTFTFFYERTPDPRLARRTNVKLVALPGRNKTFHILREMLTRPRILAYVDASPASYVFLHLPSFLRRETIAVRHAEAPAAQAAGLASMAKFLNNGVASRCSVHTAITEFVAADLQASGYTAKFILPVGVDTQTFVPPPTRQNPQPVVLFAGTIIERKGAHLVVEAARLIPEAQFRLVGAGRGGFEKKLKQQVRHLELRNVQFLGPQQQSDLVRIMQESDMFVLPSRLEGIPKVTLEAAATGLPCVVFHDYESPSVIDGKTGFQVRTFEEMVDRLRTHVHNAKLRLEMSAAARLHACSFDWDIVARIWEQAYLQIAAGTSHSDGRNSDPAQG